MKKIYLIFFLLFFLIGPNAAADYSKYEIKEGNENAKVKIYIFESLTCPHCADFHKNIYPNLKSDFIDKGLVQIYFKNFPLDLAGLNAAKTTYCLNSDKRSVFLHHLYETQNEWVNGETIDDINKNLKKTLDNFGIKNIDFQKCINNEEIENLVLNERIEAFKKYKIQSTPTVVINEKKFDKPLKYKNLKKAIEKLI
jgi:protein-disulfide isomerase